MKQLVAVALLGLFAAAPPALTAEPASAAPTSTPAQSSSPGAVTVFNRRIVEFRVSFLGFSAQERAERVSKNVRELLSAGGPGEVKVEAMPEGHAMFIDGKLAYLITPGDAISLAGEKPAQVAERSAEALRRVVAETREARSFDTLMGSLARAGIATAILAVALWVLRRLRGWIAAALAAHASRHAHRLKVGGRALLHREQVFAGARGLTTAVFWLLVLMLAYEWLGYAFSQFPYTRPWGEGPREFMLNLGFSFLSAIVGALPDLIVAFAIFVIAGVAARGVRRFLEPFVRGEAQSGWLDRDTASPTGNLVRLGIWVFAVAMAYPYLPGSQSDAFKGLSVLLGLMVSLGSSSLVGQGASGLILMFTRTIRPGEYVRIGEHEGTVVELGAFTTRIRTGLGEELTISNSLIAGAVTKNYSRVLKGGGFVVDATVTIGYDAPWRQVEAMLIDAARRTRGVLASPAPVVFQTALADFYVEYRLVAQASPSEPHPRAIVMSNLHANIQDVFNEHGVQIMSPHYLGDPAEAKVVPPEKWHLAPAPGPE